jgi:pimeloyl-ACP methyl ester carboxylesterase
MQSKFPIAAALPILISSFAFPTKAEWPTAWSGSLARPVLFVHGINSDMTTWGAKVAGYYCENPIATYVGPVRAYMIVPSIPPPLPVLTSPTGINTPSGPFVPYQAWPAQGKYFTFSSSTATTGPLAKEAGVPDWALPNTIPQNYQIMQIVVGSRYSVTCADGSSRYDQLQGWTGQLTGIKSSSGYFDGKTLMELSWQHRLYQLASNGWRDGLIDSYKSASGALGVAQAFNVKMDRNSAPDPAFGINHNGLEFYTSVKPGATAQDPWLNESDPFATINYTDGIVWNSRLGKYEVGQTNQLYAKLIKVLDEYYSDWRTNPDRQIDIVGHSQGGLVTRSVIAHYNSDQADNPVNHIHALVFLDSPHLGTAIATDNSGIPTIDELRDFVYGVKNGLTLTSHIKADTYLGPYRVDVGYTTITLNPFADLVNTLQNFTETDENLAYPYNYANPAWVPATSRMASGQVVGARSDFVTQLKDDGFPKNHRSGAKIPVTAYYGTAPGLAPQLGSKLITAANDACDGSIENVSGVLTRTVYVAAKEIDVVLTILTGEWGNVNVNLPDCYEIISDELEPYITQKAAELDNQWGQSSDFVVDQSSQMLTGHFVPNRDPFVAKPLQKINSYDPGVPHMAFRGFYGNGDLLGATDHGAEIADALKNPPHQPLSQGILALLLN